MHYVYLLRLANGLIYTGMTNDLKERFKAHVSGKVSSTSSHLPCELLWYSSFVSKEKAAEFESYLKTGSGQAFRNKRLFNK